MPRQTVSDRAAAIHCARVFLTEARRRRHDTAFHAILLQWAANARRRAAAARGLFA
jgi:hypothetical protein